MKKSMALILATLSLFALVACGGDAPAASSAPEASKSDANAPVAATETFEGPVLLVAVGESADISIAKNVMKKTGVEFAEYAEGTKVADYKSAVLVPGVSVKGLGEAGIDVAAELAATEALLAELEAANVKVIVAHLGGSSRRDELTDQFLDVVLPAADYIVALEEGNKDGKFSDFAAANGVANTMADGLASIVTVFGTLYAAK
ncbi:MAG: hypothetical protein IJP02_06605 [Oscillospiraceae bacterium]|nr:hypothetical protein [Oscillospiraceae bacterium]